MELPYTVKVLEECQISPPFGSVPPTSLSLIVLDMVFLPMPPVRRLYFYEFPHPKTHFMNTILPNIKQSLSLALQHFYPLAGNITWPQESIKPEIAYKDGDAVSLTVAESDYNFDKLAGYQARDVIESYPLFPKLRSATCGEKKLPLLALQVTIFPEKGICIGVTISHVATDGRSSNHFMRSWASICKLEGDTSFMADSLPFYDRSTFKPQEQNDQLFMAKMNITKETLHALKNDDLVPPTDKVQASFVMSRSDIARLKQWISTCLEMENGTGAPMRLSSFVVGLAYVWVCAVKARWGEADTSEAIEHVMVPVDTRARQNPPLPVTYFGNCIGSVDVMAKRSDLIGKDGVQIAAKSIGSAIKNYDIEAQKDLSYYISLPPEQVVRINSSPKFGVYDTDFGWGRPKKAEMSATHTGQNISVTDCPNEEGAIEFGLVRSKIEMDAFTNLFANSMDLS